MSFLWLAAALWLVYPSFHIRLMHGQVQAQAKSKNERMGQERGMVEVGQSSVAVL